MFPVASSASSADSFANVLTLSCRGKRLHTGSRHLRSRRGLPWQRQMDFQLHFPMDAHILSGIIQRIDTFPGDVRWNVQWHFPRDLHFRDVLRAIFRPRPWHSSPPPRRSPLSPPPAAPRSWSSTTPFIGCSDNHFNSLPFQVSLETNKTITCAAKQSLRFRDDLKRRLLKR